jgi:hypothetical protein
LSHVSEAMIMSGSAYSSMLQNSSRLAFILWKFIFNSLKLFLLTANLNETSTSINDSIQSTTNIGPPQCTSSPTKQNKCPVNKKSLRLLNINFQSMHLKTVLVIPFFTACASY